MNLLIAADKADIKTYEAIAKTAPNTTVLGTVTKIDTNFTSLLREKYNPHAILIDTDVKVVGIRVQSAVDTITQQFPYMKILILTSEDDHYDYHADCIVQGQVSNIKLKEILNRMANGSALPDAESNDDVSEERIPHRITSDSLVVDNLSTAQLRKSKRFSLPRLNPVMLSGIAAGALALIVVVLFVMKGVSKTGQVATRDEAVTSVAIESTAVSEPVSESESEDIDIPTFPIEYSTEPAVTTTVVPPTIGVDETTAAQSAKPQEQPENKPTAAAPQTGGSSSDTDSRSGNENSGSNNSSGNSNGGNNSGGNSGGNNSSGSSNGSQSSQPVTKVYAGDPVVSYDDNGRYNNSGGNAVSSVKLNYSSKTLQVGDMLQLTATVSPSNANQTISWNSSNSSVVSVKNGKLTAGKAGKATITATAVNGKSASCEVTVNKKEQTDNIHLSASEYHVKVGQTITLTLYGTDSCEWSSSNSNAVRLYPNGNQVQLVARRTGSYRVYAKDKKTQKSYTCQIYIE